MPLVIGANSFFGNAGGRVEYDYNEDKLNLNLGFSFLGHDVKLFNTDINDFAQNAIGKPLDAIGHAFEGIYNKISPQAKERQRVNNELNERAKNVQGIRDLNEMMRVWGESEAAKKGNEVVYEAFRGKIQFLNALNEQEEINRLNIERQDKWIAHSEKRLDKHDEIIKIHTAIINDHEVRITRQEKTLQVHTAILMDHERRLNKNERMLNIHEKRLNEHDRILSRHSSILQNHEQRLNEHAKAINKLFNITNEHGRILNIHGQKLNELDKRMTWAEDSIMKLNMHGEAINELYEITNQHQIQLNMHTRQLNDHQNAIVELSYNYNNLKERVERDEKIINNLGEEVNKVIKFSVDTRDIVDGLSYQTQIHKDLIIQNNNDCIEIRKELINQADFIISQHEFMKELSKENQAQWQLIDKHEKDIQEIKILARSLSDEIKNIYKELNKLNDRVDNLEKRWEEFKNEDIMLEAEEAEEEIKNRFEELTEQVNKFSDIKKSDFAKSIIIANNNGQFNIENMENVADNIQNYK